MKKIMLAVFAVLVGLAGVSNGCAAGISFNFDGGEGKSIDAATNVRDISFDAILKSESDAVSAVPIPVLERIYTPTQSALEQIDASILSAIEYSGKHFADVEVVENLKKLLVYGSDVEKLKFSEQARYTFPKRFVEINSGPFFNEPIRNRALGNCVKWATKEVCIEKETWMTACVFGAVVCYAASGGTCGPAGAVCSLVSRMIPECNTVPTHCIEWDPESVPGYGNPGAGL